MRTSLSVATLLMLTTTEETCGTATDNDQDGWYSCQSSSIGGLCDCDDTNPLTYPGADEANSSGDDDCDGIAEWGITFTRYDAGQRFTEPIQLTADTVSALYGGRRCDFTSEGTLIDCPDQNLSSGKYCASLQQLINRDGNLVIAGINSGSSSEPPFMCFMVIDPHTGQTLVESLEIPVDRYPITEMIQTLDGGYVISGAQQVPESNYIASLTKIGALGDLEWARSYGQATWKNYAYYFNTVSETTNGDLVALGRSCIDAPQTCERIVRVDASGDQVWNLDGLPDNEIDLSGTSAPNLSNGVILCGKYTSMSREVIVSLNDQANVDWQHFGDYKTWCRHVSTLWDGSVITSSQGYDTFTHSYFLSTSHLTGDGDSVWSNRMVAYNQNETTAITSLPDGSIVITGITDGVTNSGCLNASATLLHLDPLANPPPISEVGSCRTTSP